MIKLKPLTNIIDCLEKLGSVTGEAHSLVSPSVMLTLDHPSYIPTNFTLKELFPPEIIAEYGESSYMFMDSRILWTVDAIREWTGKKLFVNIPSQGLTQRGFRSTPIKSKRSAHLFGRAIDFNIEGMTDEETQNMIKSNFGKVIALRFITRMEEGTRGWTHIDCVNTGKDSLTIFKG